MKTATTQDAKDLALMYINEKGVGQASLSDCEYIGTAIVHNKSVLVSWNFKHIVNFNKIKLFNSVNLKLGYSTIDIKTPLEFIGDD